MTFRRHGHIHRVQVIRSFLWIAIAALLLDPYKGARFIEAAKVPHVNECNFCFTCQRATTNPPGSTTTALIDERGGSSNSRQLLRQISQLLQHRTTHPAPSLKASDSKSALRHPPVLEVLLQPEDHHYLSQLSTSQHTQPSLHPTQPWQHPAHSPLLTEGYSVGKLKMQKQVVQGVAASTDTSCNPASNVGDGKPSCISKSSTSPGLHASQSTVSPSLAALQDLQAHRLSSSSRYLSASQAVSLSPAAAAAQLAAATLILSTPVFDGDVAAARAWVEKGLKNKAVNMHSHHSGIVPLLDLILEKYKLPNCSVCHGCSTDLTPVKALFAFGQDWKLDQGASPEWLFFADTSDTPTTGKRAVLKVWCMPIDKVKQTFRWICTNDVVATRSVRFLLAQQRVVEECGLLDTTIKVWLAPVNAILPGVGLHVWWDGLWMEKADGISLNQLSYVTKKTWAMEKTMELMNNMNGSRVVQAAMLDLLTSQCDRHSQNVFMDEHGKLTLIDNQQALKYNWVKCGVDSIFLPGTQENEIVRTTLAVDHLHNLTFKSPPLDRFGGDWVGKRQGGLPRRYANPMILLDYRCHVPGGLIGTAYPPALKQCLRKLSSMNASQIQESYGFPMLRNAEVLLSRASDMHHKGFEWALRYGEPRNLPPHRYKLQPPCCKLRWEKGGGTVCAHEWNLTAELPVGDPFGGGPWKQKWPDVGIFTLD